MHGHTKAHRLEIGPESALDLAVVYGGLNLATITLSALLILDIQTQSLDKKRKSFYLVFIDHQTAAQHV